MWTRHGNIFNAHHAQVPIVERQNNLWRIYYTTRINNLCTPCYFDTEILDPKNILYKHTNNLLPNGELGSFDVNGILVADICNIGNEKYMYYIGWVQRKDVKFHHSIGLARYIENKWVKFSDGPIFNTSYKDSGSFSGVPRIINNNNSKDYLMFYTSTIKWEQKDNDTHAFYNLKRATSNNAIDWEPQGVVLDLKDNEGGITCPSVIFHKKHYYMWYSVRSSYNNAKNQVGGYVIRCVKSADLTNWVRYSQLDLLPVGGDDWDSEMTCFPYVFISNETVFLFYSGNGYGRTGIGYATLDLFKLDTIY